MVNIVLIIVDCIALGLAVFVETFALFRGKSNKKNYFLLMQAMVIIYLLGYLLELTSTNAEEAYASVKLLHAGALFVATFAFFFVTDYCNIKLNRLYVKAPMVILSFITIAFMWTTKIHHLVYLNYGFDTTFIHNLVFTPGPFYFIAQAYPAACFILSMGVLLYQMKKWKNRYRKQLLILLVCIAIPFAAECIYFFTIISGVNRHNIYFTPHAMAVMSICLYLWVMRFNIFEIISVATVTAMEHIREGFILVDEDNNYLSSNPAALMIFPGIVKLKKGESVFSTANWPEELKGVERGSVEFSIFNEGIRHFRASISPVLTESGTVMAKIILFGEITDSVNLMKELENAAYLDSLTGLYNRRHFSKLANVDIERAKRTDLTVYTAMLDLDFFKVINDTYGHSAGDLVLKVTAGIIHQTIRSYDLVGRYGGEEFVLFISDLDLDEAYKLMERIRENMECNITHYEGRGIKITCSIGLAEFMDNDTLESSINKADKALYAAKKMGRNQVQVYGS